MLLEELNQEEVGVGSLQNGLEKEWRVARGVGIGRSRSRSRSRNGGWGWGWSRVNRERKRRRTLSRVSTLNERDGMNRGDKWDRLGRLKELGKGWSVQELVFIRK